ncbi:hypothetical protein CEXT_297841 [Caerostris extrusa]|uniref:Uncharacterized protein n=1 Tax=Caerostris extrusa TaxID=172846 RepID=A0AAV4TXZ9_CAEEX|nr:hypothetical protein CEXT_297841 [Caerostris extrusa]
MSALMSKKEIARVHRLKWCDIKSLKYAWDVNKNPEEKQKISRCTNICLSRIITPSSTWYSTAAAISKRTPIRITSSRDGLSCESHASANDLGRLIHGNKIASSLSFQTYPKECLGDRQVNGSPTLLFFSFLLRRSLSQCFDKSGSVCP